MTDETIKEEKPPLIPHFHIEHVVLSHWSKHDNSSFDCMVKFAGHSETVPFTASPNDPMPHGAEIWAIGVKNKHLLRPFDPSKVFVAEQLKDVAAEFADRLSAIESKISDIAAALKM